MGTFEKKLVLFALSAVICLVFFAATKEGAEADTPFIPYSVHIPNVQEGVTCFFTESESAISCIYRGN